MSPSGCEHEGRTRHCGYAIQEPEIIFGSACQWISQLEIGSFSSLDITRWCFCYVLLRSGTNMPRHPLGVGCRALAILHYAYCQLISVVLSAWSHVKAFHGSQYWQEYWEEHYACLRSKCVGVSVATVIFLPSLVIAVLMTFAEISIQTTSVHQNCWYAATSLLYATIPSSFRYRRT